MGIDQVGKPSVHKDPDRGGDMYSNHMGIRDNVRARRYPGVRNGKHASHRGMLDIRARRYPGMVPVVEAVTMGIQAAVLLAPGCLGPGWSRSAPVVGAVTIGVQDMVGDSSVRFVKIELGGSRNSNQK